MSDAMNDGLYGTAQERQFRAEKSRAEKSKKIVHSTNKKSEATHVAKPLSGPQIRKAMKKVKKPKEVAPKCERRVTRGVRYFIFERSEKGKLRTPMERKPYDYDDTPVFDYCGYDSQELAFDAIQRHVTDEDDRHTSMGWDRTFFDNGKTYERTESYFVIPQLTVKAWWERVENTEK